VVRGVFALLEAEVSARHPWLAAVIILGATVVVGLFVALIDEDIGFGLVGLSFFCYAVLGVVRGVFALLEAGVFGWAGGHPWVTSAGVLGVLFLASLGVALSANDDNAAAGFAGFFFLCLAILGLVFGGVTVF
jgi:hypothetical protein